MELKSRNLSRYGLPYSSSNCTFMELKCLDEYCSDVLLSGSNCTFMELKCLDEYCSDVLLSGSNCTFMELKFVSK